MQGGAWNRKKRRPLWGAVFVPLLSSALCGRRSTLMLRPGVPADCHPGWGTTTLGDSAPVRANSLGKGLESWENLALPSSG